MPDTPTRPVFFGTRSAFRAWLQRHHDRKPELWVGFRRKGSGKPSITLAEAVEEALCFGWIDSVLKSINDDSYAIRFTPRKSRSHWSLVNVRRVEELARRGLMRPAGMRAFEGRSEERTGFASYERKDPPRLDAASERRFRADEKAWRWFQSQASWYRKAAIHWIVSAKRQETRLRRLTTLIEDSQRGRTVPPLSRPNGSR